MSTSDSKTTVDPTAQLADLGKNRIGGQIEASKGTDVRIIRNPANTKDVVSEVREASVVQVTVACAKAAEAQVGWRAVPAPDRVRVLYKYRELLEKNFLGLAQLLVRENGKLITEAKGDVRRGIDSVEFACGIPSHLMGRILPEVSRHADSYMIREPLGVVAGIPPFNFPAMIPLWMMPITVACGNSFILKPADKAPLTGTWLVDLFAEAGLPKGVVSVVHGGASVSQALIQDRNVQAISFVGSTAAAEQVYQNASLAGKRVQALGGAKNHLIVLPDANLKGSIPALIGSAFGCAGQRCLAGSALIAVGTKVQQDAVVSAFVAAAKELKLGPGGDETSTLCPVQSMDQVKRIHDCVTAGVHEGACLILDGRNPSVSSHPDGCFVAPTIFDEVSPEMRIARDEIFGPVVVILRAKNLEEAISIANRSTYGNSASLFTQDGASVRLFRSKIQCGMLGINLGVPAPMSMFSFGGWKRSLFGDLHAHGPDAVDFYTRKKVITERWFGAEAVEGWV